MLFKEERTGVPPNMKFDKFVDALQALVPNGPPSLIGCKKLDIAANVVFAAGVVIKGDVKIVNSSGALKTVEAGEYADTTITL